MLDAQGAASGRGLGGRPVHGILGRAGLVDPDDGRARLPVAGHRSAIGLIGTTPFVGVDRPPRRRHNARFGRPATQALREGKSYRYGRVVTVDDPWGFGNSLEWVTSCPPPRHNFTELPRIRSERPAFELHYPEYVERFRAEAHVRGRPSPYEVAAKASSSGTHRRGRTRWRCRRCSAAHRQVLEVHLAADASIRGHDEEVIEGFLRPPQQLVRAG